MMHTYICKNLEYWYEMLVRRFLVSRRIDNYVFSLLYVVLVLMTYVLFECA